MKLKEFVRAIQNKTGCTKKQAVIITAHIVDYDSPCKYGALFWLDFSDWVDISYEFEGDQECNQMIMLFKRRLIKLAEAMD